MKLKTEKRGGSSLQRCVRHLVIDHEIESAAASVWNGRVINVINASIRLDNPCLECIKNRGNSGNLRFVKSLKQQWVAKMRISGRKINVSLFVKLPTLIGRIIYRSLYRGVLAVTANPNSPIATCKLSKVVARHCWLRLETHQISVHVAKIPNDQKLSHGHGNRP
jgi:hypothetical protein